MMEDLVSINNFYNYDSKNSEFYKSHQSPFLDQHSKLLQNINQQLSILNQINASDRFDNKNRLDSVARNLKIYNENINKSVVLIRRRGFKDEGIEGEMRNYAHRLEKNSHFDKSKILMLRRHEKDFIIRNEEKYVEEYHEKIKLYRNNVLSDASISKTDKDSVLFLMKNYAECFDTLVYLDLQIGTKSNSGLKRETDLKSNQIQQLFADIVSDAQNQKTEMFSNLKKYFVAGFIIFLWLSILTTYFLSRRMTYRFSQISNDMSEYIKRGFVRTEPCQFKESSDEIGDLVKNYKILIRELNSLINDFKEKVDEKTEEILFKKNEIQDQHDELLEQNRIIEIQNRKFEIQNQYILDSIRYAKRIQEALLPDAGMLNKLFSNHFVLYKPKDILSGDFYWAKKIKNKYVDLSIIAVGDCTGHGIPGALLSMLGAAFLDEVVKRKDVTHANLVLHALEENIINSIQREGNEKSVSDTMDIAICIIDNKTKLMEFAGAKRNLFLIRDNIITEIKGDNNTVGIIYTTKSPFKNTEVQLQTNDIFYLYTDGYIDQFGGTNEKKFKNSRFKESLSAVSNLSMSEQKKSLDEILVHWKGNCTQTDDILVVGIKMD
jgi:serine phosphatase RsbU (regulator of sigma subunit)